MSVCIGGAGMGDEKQVCPECGSLVWTLHRRPRDGRMVCQSCANADHVRHAFEEG